MLGLFILINIALCLTCSVCSCEVESDCVAVAIVGANADCGSACECYRSAVLKSICTGYSVLKAELNCESLALECAGLF